MRDFHGLIFAYNANPELRELVSLRTAASLPFCGRYRLIDLALPPSVCPSTTPASTPAPSRP